MNDAVETEPSADAWNDAPPETRANEPRTGSWAMALPVGIVAAIVGLVPWWVSGARLPLQNLWEGAVRPGAMPITLMPFSQYAVILIFSMIVVGAGLAGIGGRVLRVRGWGLLLLVAGVLGVQVMATVQTALVVREGLQERLESTVYLVGLIAGTGLSIVVGLIVTILVAGAPRAGALLGLTVGAIGMASWTSALIDPTRIGEGPMTAMLVIVPWITPVLTGIAIAWTGVNTAGRVIAALISVVLVWVAPALTTAIAAALGSRVLIRSGDDVIDYGIDVFQTALVTPELALRPIIATIVVAAIGLFTRALIRRRTRGV